MPGRSFHAGTGYRYGFNGKENDNEIKGEGNQQEYGMRIYDTRLGRFLSVDPLAQDFPWNSQYCFAEGDPISNIDLDGQEKKHYLLVWDENQRVAKLQFLKEENFTETTTSWDPTWSDWLRTTSKSVYNPRMEFIVHGSVEVPYGLDGDFDFGEENVTFTFSSEEKMREAENHRGTSIDGSEYSDKWFYYHADQSFKIAASQAVFNSLEAEFETGGMRGLWRNSSVKTHMQVRVNEIHSQQSEIGQRKTTTAIGIGVDANGKKVTLVASSSPNLTRAQASIIKAKETVVTNKKLGLKSKVKVHAEQKVTEYADKNSIKLRSVTPSRPACPSCVTAINNAKANLDGKIKKVKSKSTTSSKK